MKNDYDVIVVGLGGMGSSISYHLLQKGLKVLGIDKYEPPHVFGSSHGHTRIFRQAYLEGVEYVPLAQRSYKLWRELEKKSGEELLSEIGAVMIGPYDCQIVQGTIVSAEKFNLPYEVLDEKEMKKRFPQFNLTSNEVAVFEKAAGTLFPEKCVKAYLDLAIQNGLEIRTNEPVIKWSSEEEKVTVYTEKGTYQAKKLILSSGPWSPQLFGYSIPLAVERKVPTWFQASSESEMFEPDHFPAFVWHINDNLNIYGMPGFHGEGTKVAFHQGGIIGTADELPRQASVNEAKEIRNVVLNHFPDLDASNFSMDTCLYTNTPDGHFIIGYHPKYQNVLLAGGFSGHGFKFCSVIGEILSDLATKGSTEFDLSLFDPNRFE